uniref:Uncharacterized protein n=2 Tax=viral metagenome TaxID=1070528 RepID=A0A6H2A121_9ZZZZ
MPNYQKDSWIVSVFWGRLGAAILGLLAFVLGLWGYSLTKEDQDSAFVLITTIITGVGAFLALISKLRESKKVR